MAHKKSRAPGVIRTGPARLNADKNAVPDNRLLTLHIKKDFCNRAGSVRTGLQYCFHTDLSHTHLYSSCRGPNVLTGAALARMRHVVKDIRRLGQFLQTVVHISESVAARQPQTSVRQILKRKM